VLAPALPVALSRQRPEAAVGAAGQPERQRDVDVGERVRDARRLLLGSARRQHHRAARAGEAMRGLRDRGLGHARDALDAGLASAQPPRAHASKPSVRART
jgi:hypothetical protein